jgi:YhcH/YjgK/YiaL family protein
MVVGQYPNIPEDLTGPVWQQAFSWITEHVHDLPDGEHAINGRDMYANIHTAVTTPSSQAVFEVHKEHIDLHFCLAGGELIAYSPQGSLREHTPYNGEKDYQLFMPTDTFSTVKMQSDSFAIFFPDELHMPKVTDGTHENIRKVVVKIKASLL